MGLIIVEMEQMKRIVTCTNQRSVTRTNRNSSVKTANASHPTSDVTCLMIVEMVLMKKTVIIILNIMAVMPIAPFVEKR